MKNLLLCVLAIGSIGAACSPATTEESSVNPNETFPSGLNPNSDRNVEILTDPETGCEYLVIASWHGDGYAMTPRIDREGNPICD